MGGQGVHRERAAEPDRRPLQAEHPPGKHGVGRSDSDAVHQSGDREQLPGGAEALVEPTLWMRDRRRDRGALQLTRAMPWLVQDGARATDRAPPRAAGARGGGEGSARARYACCVGVLPLLVATGAVAAGAAGAGVAIAGGAIAGCAAGDAAAGGVAGGATCVGGWAGAAAAACLAASFSASASFSSLRFRRFPTAPLVGISPASICLALPFFVLAAFCALAFDTPKNCVTAGY